MNNNFPIPSPPLLLPQENPPLTVLPSHTSNNMIKTSYPPNPSSIYSSNSSSSNTFLVHGYDTPFSSYSSTPPLQPTTHVATSSLPSFSSLHQSQSHGHVPSPTPLSNNMISSTSSLPTTSQYISTTNTDVISYRKSSRGSVGGDHYYHPYGSHHSNPFSKRTSMVPHSDDNSLDSSSIHQHVNMNLTSSIVNSAGSSTNIHQSPPHALRSSSTQFQQTTPTPHESTHVRSSPTSFKKSPISSEDGSLQNNDHSNVMQSQQRSSNQGSIISSTRKKIPNRSSYETHVFMNAPSNGVGLSSTSQQHQQKRKNVISKHEMMRVLHLPQTQASSILGCSLSTLKRRFYELKEELEMEKWPQFYHEIRHLPIFSKVYPMSFYFLLNHDGCDDIRKPLSKKQLEIANAKYEQAFDENVDHFLSYCQQQHPTRMSNR